MRASRSTARGSPLRSDIGLGHRLQQPLAFQAAADTLTGQLNPLLQVFLIRYILHFGVIQINISQNTV